MISPAFIFRIQFDSSLIPFSHSDNTSFKTIRILKSNLLSKNTKAVGDSPIKSAEKKTPETKKNFTF
ncbi:hypothetical protein CH380_17890 [Leptospira adleri]|uniref:Uncharacterized protein n=1 Tax=Leptospira adleri TaxID=2023186 RepID=A0A2M9YK66_9LEPT|nr:hypothetical protein CH380_17890 [Leptospira adleri]PJZ61659.1 hypothetical protein CH376_12270 [Leptospira adleri]